MRYRLSRPLWLLLLAAQAATAGVTQGTDPEAQLPYWEIVEEGMSLRLVQRLPDQTRGYFLARGFDAEQADMIALGCVFQAVFTNTATPKQGGDVEYNLRDWVVRAGGGHHGLKTREDWRSVWVARHVSKPAQIAFEWSLFPTRQVYRPGDYNWGMTVFGLPPGSAFDLEVVWRQPGKTRSARIEGMHCAEDLHVEPVSP
jgi:hypothetical protein